MKGNSMGYDIFFELTLKRKQDMADGVEIWSYIEGDERDRIVADFRSTNEDAHYCLHESGMGQQYGRWINHDVDLAIFSKRHPDVLFVLDCKGEENGDIWTVYALNGKIQTEQADIIIAPFDPERLEEVTEPEKSGGV